MRPKGAALRTAKRDHSVARDLTEWYGPIENRKLIICHVVDEFSRLSSEGIVPDKRLEDNSKNELDQQVPHSKQNDS